METSSSSQWQMSMLPVFAVLVRVAILTSHYYLVWKKGSHFLGLITVLVNHFVSFSISIDLGSSHKLS